MRYLVIACALCACTEDSLQPPTGERVKYVVDWIGLPASNTEARQLGLDLNGDNTIDNQFGMVTAFLRLEGADPTSKTQELIARGQLLTLAQAQRPSDSHEAIALTLFQGADPTPSPCADETDTICARHLTGDGQFSVAGAEGPALLGEQTSLPILVGPETMTTSIAFYSEVLPLELVAARVRINAVFGGYLQGTIAGGLRRSEIETKLAPAFADYLETLIASECSTRDAPPGCGCVMAEHRNWLTEFDHDPTDCAISVQEIMRDSGVVSLISPDVAIDGELILSFGFGFHAVPASF